MTVIPSTSTDASIKARIAIWSLMFERSSVSVSATEASAAVNASSPPTCVTIASYSVCTASSEAACPAASAAWTRSSVFTTIVSASCAIAFCTLGSFISAPCAVAFCASSAIALPYFSPVTSTPFTRATGPSGISTPLAVWSVSIGALYLVK